MFKNMDFILSIIQFTCLIIAGMCFGNVIRHYKVGKTIQEIRKSKESMQIKVAKILILKKFNYFFW